MRKALLSVLVSVFNREDYLRRCIDSILTQEGVDLEVIIVDDGSTDSSPKICDQYADGHDNVIVIHQKNAGISVARNVALDTAKGNFVFFMDSDDYLPENSLKTLMSIQHETDADCVMGNYARCHDDGTFEGVFELPEKYNNRLLTNRETCELILFSGHTHVLMVNWAKVYKKSVWDGIRFPAHMTKSEDQYIFPDLMERMKKIYYTNQIVYNQIFSDVSITRSNYSRKFLFHSECVAIVTDYLIKKGYYDIAVYEFGVGTRHLIDMKSVLHDKESRDEITRQYEIYRELAKKLIPKVSLKNKIRFVLYRIDMEMYAKVRNKFSMNKA